MPHEFKRSRVKVKTFRAYAAFGAVDVKVETGMRRYIYAVNIQDESGAVNVVRVHEAIPAGEVGAPLIMPALPNKNIGIRLAANGEWNRETAWDSPYWTVNGGRQLWIQCTGNVALVQLTYYDEEAS